MAMFMGYFFDPLERLTRTPLSAWISCLLRLGMRVKMLRRLMPTDLRFFSS